MKFPASVNETPAEKNQGKTARTQDPTPDSYYCVLRWLVGLDRDFSREVSGLEYSID